MKRLTRKVFGQILAAVEERAKELGIGGYMIVHEIATGLSFSSFVNNGKALMADDEGMYNVVSICFAKLGMVLTYMVDTGAVVSSIAGEVPWKGGHPSNNNKFAYAFSGAKQEEDLALMILAEAVHKQAKCDVELINYAALVEQMAASGSPEGMAGVLLDVFLALPEPGWKNELRFFWTSLFNAAKVQERRFVWDFVQTQKGFQKAMNLPPMFYTDPRKTPILELPVIGGPGDEPYATT